jgi:hypothetical protein
LGTEEAGEAERAEAHSKSVQELAAGGEEVGGGGEMLADIHGRRGFREITPEIIKSL